MELNREAPNFKAQSQQGEICLSALRGQYVVLYFYPRDNTSGCTTEAQEFRDAKQDFADANAVILGVSRDSLKSHQGFSEKQELNFALLSDEDEAICLAYDVMKMKNMYGKQARGVERSTFLIDPEGKVVALWRKVRVKEHVQEVLTTLNAQ
ncbi:MAG: peroxiredoxin [Mariprofundaceae bacterium]|nr:peroxiredoxin [Mariprofundaceae bacterium]